MVDKQVCLAVNKLEVFFKIKIPEDHHSSGTMSEPI